MRDIEMSSYYSEEMLVETSREAAAAFDRAVGRMARQTMRNMLHVDPTAADPYGGQEGLLERLKHSYQESLSSAA